MTAEIRDELRIATASIRGYYYQFLWTALSWIELKPGQALFCEGSEDIDKLLANGELQEEQIKNISGNLTETSEDIKSVLLNFAKDYVHNLRRGIKASMVFRTTAGLGNATKDPLLDSWLAGGPVDINKLAQKITDFAVHKKDTNGRVAVRYMRRYGLLNDFARAFSWNWNECDYTDIRLRLAGRLRQDPRCKGLRPEDLADAMVARIARISSSERRNLSERRLDSLDFELLVNDHLLSKQVQSFEAGARSSSLLHVAFREVNGVAVVVTGRFGSEGQVGDLFARLQQRLENHPDDVAHESVLSFASGPNRGTTTGAGPAVSSRAAVVASQAHLRPASGTGPLCEAPCCWLPRDRERSASRAGLRRHAPRPHQGPPRPVVGGGRGVSRCGVPRFRRGAPP